MTHGWGQNAVISERPIYHAELNSTTPYAAGGAVARAAGENAQLPRHTIKGQVANWHQIVGLWP